MSTPYYLTFKCILWQEKFFSDGPNFIQGFTSLHQFEWVSQNKYNINFDKCCHLIRDGCLEKCLFLRHGDGHSCHGFGKLLVTWVLPVYRLMTTRIIICIYVINFYILRWRGLQREPKLSSIILSLWINRCKCICSFDCATTTALTLTCLILYLLF